MFGSHPANRGILIKPTEELHANEGRVMSVFHNRDWVRVTRHPGVTVTVSLDDVCDHSLLAGGKEDASD